MLAGADQVIRLPHNGALTAAAADAGELADNAASTMGALFRVDPRTLSREEIMDIITESI